jgi:raffinose/stachyose/melibiose transport system substrate-binding protein
VKRTLGVLPIVLALTLVSGVSGGIAKRDSGAGKQQDVTITLLQDPTFKPAFDILIKNFNNVYPNIHVEPTYLATSVIRNLLLTELAAGKAPDMFSLSAGNNGAAAVWPVAKAGQLLDLSQGPWVGRLGRVLRPAATYAGKVYAQPTAAFLEGVAYNPTLFNKLGLKAPQTFGQLLTMCQRIKAAGKIPFAEGFGEVTGWSIFREEMSGLFVYGPQPNWNTLRSHNKVTFQSSSRWRRALQVVVDMNNAGCFSPGASGTTLNASLAQLVRGDAVMSLVSTTQGSVLTGLDPTFHPGWFIFPGDTAARTYLVESTSNLLAVNAATAHPNEVKKFIDFLGRPKQASLFARILGASSDQDLKHCVFPASFQKAFLAACKANKLVLASQSFWVNPNMTSGYLAPSYLGLLTGQRSIDDILEGLDYMWDNPDSTSPP